MAYLGARPSTNFRVAPTKDTFTGDGSTTTFDLANKVPAGGENALQVFVENVRQEPGSGKAYTLGADGSGDLKRITFSAAPVASAEIYVITTFSNEAFSNLDLNGSELQLDADGDTTITADTDDQIDIKVAGADDFQIVANNFKVLSGSTLTIESGATITNSGTANNFGISAADDLTAGDAAVNLTTTSGNITIDAQGSDTDIIFKGTDGSSDITPLTLDMSEAGKALFTGGITMSGTTPTLTIGDAGEEDTKIVFDGNAQDYHVGLDDSSDTFTVGLGSTLGTTSYLTIDAAGHARFPNTSCFQAHLASDQSVSGSTSANVTMNTESFDVNSDFNTSNYTFTAPVTGKYILTTQVSTYGISGSSTDYGQVQIQTSNAAYNDIAHQPAGNNIGSFQVSVVADMDANDTAFVSVHSHDDSDYTVRGSRANTFFSGILIG